MKSKTPIAPEVMAVLQRSIIGEREVKLPPEQLPRPLYVAVNKVLTDAGGKWNRSRAAHVFGTDPRERLGMALATGKSTNVKKELQQFYTPPELARRMAKLADVYSHVVLEPSAGRGALVDACREEGARKVFVCELDPANCQHLLDKGCHFLQHGDFLSCPQASEGHGFTRIVMNPPWTRNQDVKHVQHAFLRQLERGPVVSSVRLVALMAPNRQRKAFTNFIEDARARGFLVDIWDIEPGTFRGSGTEVGATLVRIMR
jgi:predicted RNA methylase